MARSIPHLELKTSDFDDTGILRRLSGNGRRPVTSTGTDRGQVYGGAG